MRALLVSFTVIALTACSPERIVAPGAVALHDLGGIDPADIERIEVIKGAAAASLYGSRSCSAIIIRTRKP
jgi:outer membrane receptor protein involved in Fe transport